MKPRIALFVKSCDGGLFTQNRDEQEIVKGIGIGFLSCIGIGIAKTNFPSIGIGIGIVKTSRPSIGIVKKLFKYW